MNGYEICLAIFGGFFAGCINTLAGNGSIITLGIMTELLGLSGNMANGTNRVGIFVQGIFSLEAFARNKKIHWSKTSSYLITGLIGAIIGAWVAVQISSEDFKLVYKYLMLVLLVILLIHPKHWLNPTEISKKLPAYIYIPIFLCLGFYGGFIQMGMGLFFLAIMVLVVGLPLVEANAVKVLMVTAYTLVVILIFHYKGYIDWKIGSIIAMGQGLGGWLTAQYASVIPSANKWAYRMLIVIMIVTLLKLFHIV
ncbi:MAG: sulfite exporter TauE/SafE family protein [Bacteroidota bacterium]|nr:sulfite exporter TauE/SafE family protein [Bacteroidota bacterium]